MLQRLLRRLRINCPREHWVTRIIHERNPCPGIHGPTERLPIDLDQVSLVQELDPREIPHRPADSRYSRVRFRTGHSIVVLESSGALDQLIREGK